jgi:hypothetical protein
MRASFCKHAIATFIRQLRAMNRKKEIEVIGCEVTQIQINRAA